MNKSKYCKYVTSTVSSSLSNKFNKIYDSFSNLQLSKELRILIITLNANSSKALHLLTSVFVLHAILVTI